MINSHNIINLEIPETSDFITYKQATTSEFLTYNTDNTLIPNSFDKVIKNSTFFWTFDALQ